MQYRQRRLQRSVTERRRLASGLPSASRAATDDARSRTFRFDVTTSLQVLQNDATRRAQCAARVLSVRPFLAYTESGDCPVESSLASRMDGVATLRGGDTNTGRTAETSITPALMCSAPRGVAF